jgi:Mrp family chromosome partitioning ATPase
VSTYREEFRRIDRALFGLEECQGSCVIQFTSSHFSEGVTTITLAMALFMAEIHGPEEVIAVEANLRQPSFQDMLALPSSGSLAGVLDKTNAVQDAVQQVDNYPFSVMPAGTLPERKGDDLLLTQFQGVLTELRKTYRFILVDSPPVIPFGDAAMICPMVDGTLIVVASNFTRAEVLEHTVDKLKDAEAKIPGIVLNKREYHIPRWLYHLV